MFVIGKCSYNMHLGVTNTCPLSLSLSPPHTHTLPSNVNLISFSDTSSQYRVRNGRVAVYTVQSCTNDDDGLKMAYLTLLAFYSIREAENEKNTRKTQKGGAATGLSLVRQKGESDLNSLVISRSGGAAFALVYCCTSCRKVGPCDETSLR